MTIRQYYNRIWGLRWGVFSSGDLILDYPTYDEAYFFGGE